MLTHADVSAGGPAAKVALSLAGRRQQGDAGIGTQSACFTCFTCFTGTPVRALLAHQCALKEMQVGTQFACFTRTPVQILTETEAFCRRFSRDAGRDSVYVLHLLYWYTSTNTDRERGLLQAILAPHLLVARLQVAEDRARRRQQPSLHNTGQQASVARGTYADVC